MRLPAIDVDSEIRPVSTQDRVLEIPPEPWVVGWWRAGVAPGSEQGTTVLVAHLDSAEYGTGPFAEAVNLQPGTSMALTGADGVERNYTVAEVASYRKEVLPYEELFAQDGPPRVVLVTCGGDYNPDEGGWDSNVTVMFAPS